MSDFDSSSESSPVQPWKFDFEIESNPDNCSLIIKEILEQLEKFEWNSRDLFAIHMAMEEGILNAIRHGNKCSSDKKVRVRLQIDGDRFYSKITDEGEGFILEEVPDPTLEENLERTSGRGVMLIRMFMDRVIYNDKGNSVEFFKSRKKGSSGSED